MPYKFTIIGAGSKFSFGIAADLIREPAFADSTLALVDPVEQALDTSTRIVKRMVETAGASLTIAARSSAAAPQDACAVSQCMRSIGASSAVATSSSFASRMRKPHSRRGAQKRVQHEKKACLYVFASRAATATTQLVPSALACHLYWPMNLSVAIHASSARSSAWQSTA